VIPDVAERRVGDSHVSTRQGDNDMYAQLVEGGTTPELREEMRSRSGSALGSIAAISTGTRAPISFWEVNAALPSLR
jgi:hypothetical protein